MRTLSKQNSASYIEDFSKIVFTILICIKLCITKASLNHFWRPYLRTVLFKYILRVMTIMNLDILCVYNCLAF